MKLKSKRACIQTVHENITAAPLQTDSVSVSQLGSTGLREDGIVDISESAGGEMAGSYHSRNYLEIASSRIASWGQLAKPLLVDEDDSWLDPEISPPLFMDLDSAHSLPNCPSPDVLCQGSSHMQTLSMPSSPILSEGSWDSEFNACHGPENFAIEVSSAIDLDTDYSELQPAFQCLGSGSNDIFQDIPRPLRAREPWISPPTTRRDSGSRISLSGRELNEWTLPAVSPSLNVLLSPLPSRSWSELVMDGSRRASNVEDVTAESCSDVEEAQFHRDLHSWSDRLGKPVYALGQVGDYNLEVNQVRLSLGRILSTGA